MNNLLTYDQLNEMENVHATTRQISAFKKAMEEEASSYECNMEDEQDGERFVRLKLMSGIYRGFVGSLDRASGNVLDAFRELYVRYLREIEDIDQPDKFPGAFVRIDDVDPVTAQVKIRRHP